jgi:hypothetical protein
VSLYQAIYSYVRSSSLISAPHTLGFAELRLGTRRLPGDPLEICGDPGVVSKVVQRGQVKNDQIPVGVQGMNLPVASLAKKCGRQQGSAFLTGNQMMDGGCERGTAA